MKEFIGIVKSLWQNKRTRALSILILYFIFFIFVFLTISSMNKNYTPKVDEPEKQDTSSDKFSYLKNIEIINYSVYDIYNNQVLEYDDNLINNNIIYELVKNSILESTNYINNTNTYYISINDYERIINNKTVLIDGGIRIIISDNNIILDFTEYYGYKINIDIRS